ncbi:ribonuclease HII [Caldanaerobius polysaccharolyticus]|uniref:ribonuclease HII n=1 Tax=Caldanaerobius polysaccharolyticus TaxID=44256 RepID=UPI00068B3C12|nr:ribonuclease HII [Caldanaerobius polysaccharolyticus]
MKEQEKARLDAMMCYETQARNTGYKFIGGIDEAGRGPLAGPVVAACVILPEGLYIEGLNDSKKLTPSKREKLYLEIQKAAVDIGIGLVDQDVIDEINILNATKKAMMMAIDKLRVKPDIILTDAVKLDVSIPQISIIKGDQKSASIAAASIIAKVYRDRLMIKYHEDFPQYGFKSNKGYGTKTHIEAIKKYGITPLHRKSFTKKFIES